MVENFPRSTFIFIVSVVGCIVWFYQLLRGQGTFRYYDRFRTLYKIEQGQVRICILLKFCIQRINISDIQEIKYFSAVPNKFATWLDADHLENGLWRPVVYIKALVGKRRKPRIFLMTPVALDIDDFIETVREQKQTGNFTNPGCYKATLPYREDMQRIADRNGIFKTIAFLVPYGATSLELLLAMFALAARGEIVWLLIPFFFLISFGSNFIELSLQWHYLLGKRRLGHS